MKQSIEERYPFTDRKGRRYYLEGAGVGATRIYYNQHLPITDSSKYPLLAETENTASLPSTSSLPEKPSTLRNLINDPSKPETASSIPVKIPDAADPHFTFFYEVFEAVATTPSISEKIAVSYQDEKVTYKELNQQANQLAHYLLKQGVKPESVIVIALPRSIEAIVALLGIMKSGAAFSILSLPVQQGEEIQGLERFKYCLELLRPVSIITKQKLFSFDIDEASHSSKLIDLSLSETKEELKTFPDSNPEIIDLDISNLAYITFTSGSTGNPKGVMIEHRCLKSRLVAPQELMRITPEDKVAQFCRLDIDASIMEIMLGLGTGAELVLIPPHIRSDYEQLSHYYNAHKISITIFTPTVWQKLNPARFEQLRVMLTTGEGFDADALKPWVNEKRLLINGYGPSEVTIATSMSVFDAKNDMVTIGKPLPGLEMLLLDHETQNPIEEEEREGEIYIKGSGVGRGYYSPDWMKEEDKKRLDQLNKKSFLAKLNHVEDSWYRTGDKAKFTRRKQLIITGRYDRQFKIGGRLVAPENIEKELCEITAKEAGSAYIYLRQSGDNKKHIVAGMLGKFTDEELYHSALRLSRKLDTQLLPHRWYPVDPADKKFPAGGDWKSELGKFVQAAEAKDYRLARKPLETAVVITELQTELIALWQKVLLTPEERTSVNFTFGIDDPFYLLGGDSLAEAALITEFSLSDRFKKITFSVSILRQNNTVRYLARYIERFEKPLKLHIFPGHADSDEPALFFIHPLTGKVIVNYADLASQFSDRTVYGLEIRDPHELEWDSIEELAADYVCAIRRSQSNGPYIIVGHSAGGVIAYEIGVQLKNQGFEATVFLLDSLSPELIKSWQKDEYASLIRGLVETLQSCLGLPETESIVYTGETHPLILDNALTSLLGCATTPNAKSIIESAKKITQAIWKYEPTGTAHNVHLLRATKTSWFGKSVRLGWREEQIQHSYDVEADHQSVVLASAAIIRGNIKNIRFTSRMTEDIDTSLSFFKIPHANRYFVGREEHLLKIAQELQTPPRGIIGHAIAGMGGVGKTQLAIEYANRAKKKEALGKFTLNYDMIYWINAQQLNIDFRSLARALKIREEDYKQDSDLSTVVYANLASRHKKFLTILDDVENYAAVKSYLPSTLYGQCHILMTTRAQQWTGTTIKLVTALNDFSRAESKSCIHKWLPDEPDEDADSLAALLHDFPLALTQAVAYITETPFYFIKTYLAEYQEHEKMQQDLLEKTAPELCGALKEDPKKRAVYTTWHLSIEKLKSNKDPILKEHGELAEKILCFSAYLLAHDVPIALMEKILTTGLRSLREAIKLLMSHSLIQYQSGFTYGMHQLLQEVICLHERNHEAGYVATLLVSLSSELKDDDHEVVKEQTLIFNHLDHLVTRLMKNASLAELAEEARHIIQRVGFIQIFIGSYENLQKAIAYFDHAANTVAKYNDSNKRIKLAKLLSNLAIESKKVGLTDMGERLSTEAIRIHEEVIGPETIFQSILAHIKERLGDAEGQKKIFERLLQHQEAVYKTKKHINMVAVLINLANAEGQLGDLSRKKELLLEALQIQEAHYGTNEHIEIVPTLMELADVEGELRNFEMKKILLAEALRIQETSHGTNTHIKTASTLMELANTEGDLGDLNRKKELLLEALQIQEAHYKTKDHMEITFTLGNLALVEGELGNLAKKKELLMEVLRIEKIYYKTRKHIGMITTLVNLADIEGELGDFVKQKDLLMEVLQIEEAHYKSKEHFKLVSTLMKIAFLEGILGNFVKKKELLTKVLKIQRAHYKTKEHINIADTLTKLSITEKELGNSKKAKELQEMALLIQVTHYKTENHIEVAKSQFFIARACDDLNDRAASIFYLNKAYPVYLQHYGDTHEYPETILRFLIKAHLDEVRDSLERNDIEAAISHDDALVKLNPDNDQIYYSLTLRALAGLYHAKAVTCGYQEDLLARAKKHFNEAIRIHINSQACMEFANFLFNLRSFSEAIPYLTQAITNELEGDNKIITYQASDKMTVPEIIRAEIETNADAKVAINIDEFANFLLVQCYLETHQPEKARDAVNELGRCIAKSDATALSYCLLGLAYKLLKDYPMAVDYFALALSLREVYAFAEENLRECETKLTLAAPVAAPLIPLTSAGFFAIPNASSGADIDEFKTDTSNPGPGI